MTRAICTRATAATGSAPVDRYCGRHACGDWGRRSALSSVALLLTSCAPLLAANPRYATDDGAGPQGAPPTTAEAAGPPALEAPKNDDLSWQDCTVRVFSRRRGARAVRHHPGLRHVPTPTSISIKGADGVHHHRRGAGHLAPTPRPTPDRW